MPSFRLVSTLTAVIASLLFIVLLFVPEIAFSLFAIEENQSAFFIARRAAMLFLGIAVVAWVGRDAPHSASRQALCIGLTVAMLALVVLGTAELIRGFAGVGILLAVFTEALLGGLYLRLYLSNRDAQEG
nr:hypothetical protein [uncultured Pseudomonas sp.]